jgi:hypothetical protein
MRIVALAAGLALSGALSGAPEAGAAPALLRLDAATQARLGVVTAPLAAARHSATVSGFARALDPGPLAQLESDLAAAAAAAAASQAEARRTRALNAADQTVSKQAAEAAQAQARADAAKLSLLRQRVALEWSPVLARLTDARRGRLVGEIAAGRAALVRIDVAGGLAQGGGWATLELPGGPARAQVLGPARAADARLQTTGLLALVTGPAAIQLGVGAVAPATLAADGGASGVVIPREALLRSGGRTWVFVRRDATSFERREVADGASDPGGLFVAGGFRPGEPVVTQGAAQLFAAQAAPSRARPAGAD